MLLRRRVCLELLGIRGSKSLSQKCGATFGFFHSLLGPCGWCCRGLNRGGENNLTRKPRAAFPAAVLALPLSDAVEKVPCFTLPRRKKKTFSSSKMRIPSPNKRRHACLSSALGSSMQRSGRPPNINHRILSTYYFQPGIKRFSDTASLLIQDFPPRSHHVRHPGHLERSADMQRLLCQRVVVVDGRFARGQVRELAFLKFHPHDEPYAERFRPPVAQEQFRFQRVERIGLAMAGEVRDSASSQSLDYILSRGSRRGERRYVVGWR